MSVGFGVAALAGIAPDGGLYVPESIPELPASVRSSLASMDFRDLAFEVAKPFVSPDIPESALEDMIQDAYPFGAPLVPAGDRFVLELFHGPTAAFKDFGARFMSRAFAYLRRGEDKPLRILVATSGDTGGAVADGFHGVPGIQVTVLYPKGRVSPLQERQIAGLGGNVSAFAVEGSFDDCQALVKAAFADAGLNRRVALSSGDSINISGSFPGSSTAAAASRPARVRSDVRDSPDLPEPARRPRWASLQAVVFCVPRQLRNLTAGRDAKKMGLPRRSSPRPTPTERARLPETFRSARSSQATISNAMDVGAPSNFERMAAFWSHAELSAILSGASVGDDLTKDTIVRTYERTGYALDPHTAVGWNALDAVERREERPFGVRCAATAHRQNSPKGWSPGSEISVPSPCR
jgi:threonine synthase